MTEKRGLYIHIPFCVKKCIYCAFLSFAEEPAVRKAYTDALCSEIRLRAEGAGQGKGINSIYVGGGTPSVLDVSQMRDIMHTAFSCFDIRADAEITIEANPGTLGAKDRLIADKLTAYRSMGFNRLSMGVQSMDNDRLEFLGRIHTAENVARDVRIAREAGFDNINLDLIFSVPGETKEDALEDARRITELAPEHISCYSLQIEEGTLLDDMTESGECDEVSDEEDRETYHAVTGLLRNAGYEHYEISNFARSSRTPAPGFGAAGDAPRSIYQSFHNSLYWDMSEYIACGLGASGFADGVRYRNTDELNEYMNKVCSGIIPAAEEIANSPFDSISEAVFTGLRRREGIRYEDALRAYDMTRGAELPKYSCSAKDRFREIFTDAFPEVEDYVRQGLLIADEDGLRLTEQGIDISNAIMALFV